MATKSKTYNQIKFPYDVIDKAYKEFLKSVGTKNKKSLHRTWDIEDIDAKWTLDSETQFISEYVKDEIIEASFLCFDLGDIKFSVSFSNRSFDKPNTRISISLGNREKIEKIFDIFEAGYSEFIEKVKAIDNNNNSNSQIASRYTYEKKLPSVFVDKNVLVDLEHYILQRGSQLDPRKKQIPDYTVTVIDSAGTLSLQNIESYPREVFDNEIETITLSYGKSYENVKIYLRFGKSKERAEIEISYNGENAQEVVESLKVGIYQRLKDSKTWNFIYHPHFAVTAILIYPLLVILGATLYAVYKTGIWSQQGIAVTLLLTVYLIAPYFKPYITFDTRRNILIRKWSGWLIESLMGILLIWLVASLFPSLVP
jgi:hypothetical protein